MRKFVRRTKYTAMFEPLRSALKKYTDIPIPVLDSFKLSDRFGTFKYIEKMCELFDNGFRPDYILHIMTEYQKYERFYDDKDITHKIIDDILNDISEGKIRVETTIKASRDRDRARGLIYDKNNIRVYGIETFEDMSLRGLGTKWCISLNRETFDRYNDSYKIYVIFDLNRSEDDPYRKVCYLNMEVDDMFVSKDNIHFFDTNSEYQYLRNYYGSEILKTMKARKI